MARFPRLEVRSPRPFDIVGPHIRVIGVGAAVEGSIGVATLFDANGAEISRQLLHGPGFSYELFDTTVDVLVPPTGAGTLLVVADNPSGLPEHELRISIPLSFADRLVEGLGNYAGYSRRTVVAGDTLFGIAREVYGDGERWRHLHTANRDIVLNPDALQIGVELRIPLVGPAS